MDTTGNQHFVPYSEVFRGFWYTFLVVVVLRNRAVEHNVAMFQSFPLLYAGGKG